MCDNAIDEVVEEMGGIPRLRGIEVPSSPNLAEIDAARGYLRACVEMAPRWTEAHTAEVDAMAADVVIERALRLWPEGWTHFCEYFASDIRAYEAEQAATAATKKEGN
ncbi:hypothetical protein AB0J47_02615 [Nocardia sp. NPDC049737]|uniref:hypothetical protein n=1 Tax=Nocardia sp. NPDC049737 TaxID=3154358 RepID=UPI00342EE818